MKQVICKGLKDIIVDEVPDPVVSPHHVLVRPACSLISSGTETASIHQEGLVKEVAQNRPATKVETALAPAAKAERCVALAGAGNLARWTHLPALKKLSGVHLQAVHSASGARGKSYALRFGASYCTSDYDQILKDPTVNAVVIVTRNQLHDSQALAAHDAGKHVFVEKPMALTAEECRRLHRAVVDSGRQLSVGFNRRFAPFDRDQKRALARSVSAYSLPTGKQDPIGENNVVASFRFTDGSVGNLTYCTVGSKTSGGERVEGFAQGGSSARTSNTWGLRPGSGTSGRSGGPTRGTTSR
jgi:hypothetical protein